MNADVTPGPVAEAPLSDERILSRRMLFVGAGVVGLGLIGADLVADASATSAQIGPWGGYSNGQIPLSALTPVDYPRVVPFAFPGSLPKVYLEHSAAGSLVSMLMAYYEQTGDYLEVNEGYRTLAGQNYWWNYYGHNPALAAVPGTSNHGWGQAFDFTNLNSTRLAWIDSHSMAYGYTGIGSEDWHFNYTGDYIPPTRQGRTRPKMISIRDPRNERWWAIGNGDPVPFGNNIPQGSIWRNFSVEAFQRVWGPGITQISTQDFLDTILASTPVNSSIRPAVALSASPADRAAAADAILSQALSLYGS